MSDAARSALVTGTRGEGRVMALYQSLAAQQKLVRVPINRNATIASYYGALCAQRRELLRWSVFFIWNFLLFFWALLKACGL